MKKFPIPEVINKFNSVFNDNGFKLYVVGGAVRDFLLGIENDDFDFCTDALPEQVIALFKNTIPTGIKHGTVTVLFKGQSFEVTTFRTESDYSDNRHPDKIEYVRTLQEDLSRRDFTINAFAADCSNGQIIDLYHGRFDLIFKNIKAIGNPEERFKEDALRMMRMARFSSKLQFKPNKKTYIAACKLHPLINNVSKERICDELFKTLMTKKPSVGINLLYNSKLLNEFLPELSLCSTISQNKYHANNVFEHILIAVDEAAKRNYNLTVRIALLLHDIGKNKQTIKIDEEGNTRFYGHDIVGAKMAVNVLKDLKCSNQMINDVNVLIQNHMVKYQSNWTDGAVKRFINRVGQENITNLFNLQWCDQIASEGFSKEDTYSEFIERIENCKKDPLTIKDLDINGNDLAEIGIPKSKEMKRILEELLNIVIDNPKLNNKEYLKIQALEFFKN